MCAEFPIVGSLSALIALFALLSLAALHTGSVGTRHGAQFGPRDLPKDARERYFDPDVLQPR